MTAPMVTLVWAINMVAIHFRMSNLSSCSCRLISALTIKINQPCTTSVDKVSVSLISSITT
jgi:hypothetical protein